MRRRFGGSFDDLGDKVTDSIIDSALKQAKKGDCADAAFTILRRAPKVVSNAEQGERLNRVYRAVMHTPCAKEVEAAVESEKAQAEEVEEQFPAHARAGAESVFTMTIPHQAAADRRVARAEAAKKRRALKKAAIVAAMISPGQKAALDRESREKLLQILGQEETSRSDDEALLTFGPGGSDDTHFRPVRRGGTLTSEERGMVDYEAEEQAEAIKAWLKTLPVATVEKKKRGGQVKSKIDAGIVRHSRGQRLQPLKAAAGKKRVWTTTDEPKRVEPAPRPPVRTWKTKLFRDRVRAARAARR